MQPITGLSNMMDSHHIYGVFYDHREAIKGREIYGDKQVHAIGLTTNRLPKNVIKMNPPFGKNKGSVLGWYWLPNVSIDIILTTFKIAGYEVIDRRIGRDRLGHGNEIFYVAKKR